MKVLLDTSVWVDHLRKPNVIVIDLLRTHRVLIHEIVIGDLASGNLPDRKRFLADLALLDRCHPLEFRECLRFIEIKRLSGKGVGWNDIQLLGAALVNQALLWTYDKRFAAVVKVSKANFEP